MVPKGQSGTRKLVLVISSLKGGGAERVMSTMANYWAERGTEITLITLDDPASPDAYLLHPSVNRVAVHSAYRRNPAGKLWRTIQQIIAIRKVLKRTRPDTILSFLTVVNVFAIFASIGLPIRTVVSERVDPAKSSGLLAKVWSAGRRALYRHSDCVVGQTPPIRDWLVAHARVRAVAVIPNPLRALPSMSVVREEVVIGVGRLTEQKGFDTLIKAFHLVRRLHPDWRLVLIGDGNRRDELVRLSQKLGVERSVEFTGWVENVEEWQARASIVAQPSRFEGFPNVVLEAMGMGAPVIASTAAGEGLIEHRRNGLLVPVGDVQKLAEAMLELIEDAPLRLALGEAGRSVRDRFSLENIMPMWEAVLFPETSSSSVPPIVFQ